MEFTNENKLINVVSRDSLREMVTTNLTELCDRCNEDTFDRVIRVGKELYLGKEFVEVKFGNNLYNVLSTKFSEKLEKIITELDKTEFNSEKYIQVFN